MEFDFVDYSCWYLFKVKYFKYYLNNMIHHIIIIKPRTKKITPRHFTLLGLASLGHLPKTKPGIGACRLSAWWPGLRPQDPTGHSPNDRCGPTWASDSVHEDVECHFAGEKELDLLREVEHYQPGIFGLTFMQYGLWNSTPWERLEWSSPQWEAAIWCGLANSSLIYVGVSPGKGESCPPVPLGWE